MSSTSLLNFKTDPTNVIGLQYSQYKSKIYAFAISDPKSYYTQVQNVHQKVKVEMIKNLYDTIFNLLSEGKDVKNVSIIKDVNGEDLKVNYPNNRINEICLDLSATLDEMLSHVIEIILPTDIEKILTDRLKVEGVKSIQP